MGVRGNLQKEFKHREMYHAELRERHCYWKSVIELANIFSKQTFRGWKTCRTLWAMCILIPQSYVYKLLIAAALTLHMLWNKRVYIYLTSARCSCFCYSVFGGLVDQQHYAVQRLQTVLRTLRKGNKRAGSPQHVYKSGLVTRLLPGYQFLTI